MVYQSEDQTHSTSYLQFKHDYIIIPIISMILCAKIMTKHKLFSKKFYLLTTSIRGSKALRRVLWLQEKLFTIMVNAKTSLSVLMYPA